MVSGASRSFVAIDGVMGAALIAVSPGLGLRAPSQIPHTLTPRRDTVATLGFLVVGLLLVAGAVRSVCKRE